MRDMLRRSSDLTFGEIAIGKTAIRVTIHPSRASAMTSLSLLEMHGIVCSKIRKGNCWDNAVMEHFFLNLKMECV